MARAPRTRSHVVGLAIAASVAFTTTCVVAVEHHWGAYIQGHSPAIVPHNPYHGFNEQRWRRWPDHWMGHHGYHELDSTVVKEPKLQEPLPQDDAPATDQDVDEAPPPPSGVDPGMPESTPETLTPDIAPPTTDDLRPEAPPGLTDPEPAPEVAPPLTEPSTEAPPSLEPTPQTESTPTPAAPEEPTPAEPLPTPGGAPATTPGTTLPVPPTKLESRSRVPTRALKETRSPGAMAESRRSRGANEVEDAREAVFRDDLDNAGKSRVARPAARVSRGPSRTTEAELQPAPQEEAPQGEPTLFQPRPAGEPQRPASSPVKRTSYHSRGSLAGQVVVLTQADRERVFDEPASNRVKREPAAPARQDSLRRINPLREVASGNPSTSAVPGERANPLRP